MFDLKKEKIKKNVFLASYIVFAVLTLVGAIMVITHRAGNAGYTVIPMLFCLISAVLYRNSKKAIDENAE